MKITFYTSSNNCNFIIGRISILKIYSLRIIDIQYWQYISEHGHKLRYINTLQIYKFFKLTQIFLPKEKQKRYQGFY